MSTCPGKKAGSTCNATVYRCKSCGSVGCYTDGCTNQMFKSGTCQKCGKSGTYEAIR